MTMAREELRDAARKVFGERSNGDAAASWTDLADLGAFMLTVPEETGGLGLGGEAVAALHWELGRALVPGAAIAQMLAVEALTLAGGQGDLLASAIAGERVAVSLDPLPSGQVVDADLARQVLLVETGRIALAPITTARRLQTWDETRRLFDIATGEAVTIAQGASARAIAERLQGRQLLALAADSLGAAEALLEMTVAYLKERRQFDRPLAMFQALKHRAADMRCWLGGAEALLWSRTGDDVPLSWLGALKALACTAAMRVAEEAVQLHGGIGLTDEHPCHRFLKRVMLNAALGGDADHWNEITGRAVLFAARDSRKRQ